MSANDKSLQTTTGATSPGAPIPQYYNPTTDTYEAAQGANGAQSMRIEDGADVALGAKADASATDDTGSWSLIALVKRLLSKLTAGIDVSDRAARLVGHVTVDNLPATQTVAGSVTATVSNFPATQPVSGTVTANVGTTNGLALDGTLTSGSQKTQVTNFPATQAVTSTDGAQATIGATTDAAATTDTGTFSLISLTKRLLSQVATWVASIGTPGSAAPSKVTMLGATDGTNAKALKVDAQSNLQVVLRSSGGQEPVTGVPSDAQGALYTLYTTARPQKYNGASWDMERNNTAVSILTSAARTTTTPSPDQTLYNGRGVSVIIDVTAKGAAPSITVSIEVKDVASGKYVAVLTSAAITTVGTTRLRVYPGITAVANLAASDVMDRTWRVNVVHANGDSITYSVGKCDLL